MTPSILIKYIRGDANSKIILSVPHDGVIDPGNITLRIAGCSPTNTKGDCIFEVFKQTF